MNNSKTSSWTSLDISGLNDLYFTPSLLMNSTDNLPCGSLYSSSTLNTSLRFINPSPFIVLMNIFDKKGQFSFFNGINSQFCNKRGRNALFFILHEYADQHKSCLDF